jgi:hypothetical protein
VDGLGDRAYGLCDGSAMATWCELDGAAEARIPSFPQVVYAQGFGSESQVRCWREIAHLSTSLVETGECSEPGRTVVFDLRRGVGRLGPAIIKMRQDANLASPPGNSVHVFSAMVG